MPSRETKNKIITIIKTTALIITISGCANFSPTAEYQPSGLTGGYRETLKDDGSYRLEFLFNGYTNPNDALNYWHRRAAELCGGKDKYSIIDGPTVYRWTPPQRYEGIIRCKKT